MKRNTQEYRDKLKDDFITKAIKLHGNKFDYSQVDYINSRIQVNIICKKHGIFLQRPHSHLQGTGCRKCFTEKRTDSLCDFIAKAEKIYSNKYDYTKVIYKTALLKVIIKCPIHGEFLKTPNKHLSRKQGCPKCGRLNRKEYKRRPLNYKPMFIKKALKVHDSKYDYSLVEYIKIRVKVKIICKKHGMFTQIPANHLRGDGCPKCGFESIAKKARLRKSGWTYTNWEKAGNKSKDFKSFKVYIIRCWDEN